MNDATSEMLNTTFSQMKQIITALHSRLDALEARAGTTIDNAPMIFENLNNRLQGLEDKYQKLEENFEKADDERVKDLIADALEKYDPTQHMEFDSAVEKQVDEFIDNIDWEDKIDSSVIRRVIRNDITFTVEVD